MKIHYLCPYWGQTIGIETFTANALHAGYSGIEVYIRQEPDFINEIMDSAYFGKIPLVAQLYLPPANETFDEYRHRYNAALNSMVDLQPVFINSHTGKDFFSFEQNSILIEDAFLFSAKCGIQVVHETHRGRFAFHTTTILSYLQKFPKLRLNADLSHLCVVSESLLEDQQPALEQILQQSFYMHARIGFSQAPQVNNPFAPEWEDTLKQFLGWWKSILKYRSGETDFYICPEFGPEPYMPVMPYSCEPLANQWEINILMMNYLKTQL